MPSRKPNDDDLAWRDFTAELERGARHLELKCNHLGLGRPPLPLQPYLAELRALAEAAVRAPEIAFCGVYNAGKSTLLNALLGGAQLKMDVLPANAVVLKLVHGSGQLLGRLPSGLDVALAVEQLGALGFEDHSGNQASAANGFEFLTLAHPAEWLRDVTLVDTPGIGAMHDDHTEATRRYMALADAVVWVTPVQHAGNAAEAAFLQVWGRRIDLLVVNGMDKVDEEEDDPAALLQRVGTRFHNPAPPTVGVSARQALQAVTADGACGQAGGFEGFAQALASLVDTSEQSKRARIVAAFSGLLLRLTEAAEGEVPSRASTPGLRRVWEDGKKMARPLAEAASFENFRKEELATERSSLIFEWIRVKSGFASTSVSALIGCGVEIKRRIDLLGAQIQEHDGKIKQIQSELASLTTAPVKVLGSVAKSFRPNPKAAAIEDQQKSRCRGACMAKGEAGEMLLPYLQVLTGSMRSIGDRVEAVWSNTGGAEINAALQRMRSVTLTCDCKVPTSTQRRREVDRTILEALRQPAGVVNAMRLLEGALTLAPAAFVSWRCYAVAEALPVGACPEMLLLCAAALALDAGNPKAALSDCYDVETAVRSECLTRAAAGRVEIHRMVLRTTRPSTVDLHRAIVALGRALLTILPPSRAAEETPTWA